MRYCRVSIRIRCCECCLRNDSVHRLLPLSSLQLVPLLKASGEGADVPRGFLIDETMIYNRMQSLIRSAAISDPRIMG